MHVYRVDAVQRCLCSSEHRRILGRQHPGGLLGRLLKCIRGHYPEHRPEVVQFLGRGWFTTQEHPSSPVGGD